MKATPPKLPLSALLKKMDSQRASVCNRILHDYHEKITTLPGAIEKHHHWQGGYLSHIEEAMNIALVLYDSLNQCRMFEFSLSDALFTLFLHAFDKLLRYEIRNGDFHAKAVYHERFTEQIEQLLKQRYEYGLSEKELNALRYVHGEGKDYHPTRRIMQPLATFIHCCDIISARIWFDRGQHHSSW